MIQQQQQQVGDRTFPAGYSSGNNGTFGNSLSG